MKKKKDIIPAIQAGFKKGRCTIDHLVKLTNHIKKVFEEKTNLARCLLLKGLMTVVRQTTL